MIIGFDRLHSRWTCACCRSKVNCVHKCTAKWYIYQCEPHLLSQVKGEEDGSDGLFSEGDSGDDSKDGSFLSSASTYPPRGAILEEMVCFQHTEKRLPPVLPQWLLDDSLLKVLRSLIPSEEICHLCHAALCDPREITNRAMVIGLTKVFTGTCHNDLFCDVNSMDKVCINSSR